MDGFGHRMLLEHERNCGLGMVALVIVCTTLWLEHSPNLKVQAQHLFTGTQNGCLEHSADDFRTLKSLEKP